MSERTWEEIREQAAERLEAGDAREAFGTLREALAWPAALLDDRAALVDALVLFERIAAEMAPGALVERLRAASGSPEDPQALYDLGFELIEVGLNDIAATVLTRADREKPGDVSIVTELACAFERDLRHDEAARVLRASPFADENFVVRYLLAFNLVFSGETEEPRALLPGLHALATEDNHRFMVSTIEGFLQRAAAVQDATPLDRHDLRGWHFVLNGGVLLHLSPFGRDEGMNGRYAWLQDDESRCLEGIRRAAAATAALGLALPRVFALPDRDSQVLAAAAGRVLGVPVEPFPEHGSDEPGLIAAYDLERSIAAIFEQAAGASELPPAIAALREHRPGQVLWSHASCWTQSPVIAPDLVTFLHQFNTSPWGARLKVKPEGGGTEESAPDESPVEALAERIASAPLEDDALADLPALDSLCRTIAALDGEHAAGALRTSGERRRQWDGGPVPSSRFL